MRIELLLVFVAGEGMVLIHSTLLLAFASLSFFILPPYTLGILQVVRAGSISASVFLK